MNNTDTERSKAFDDAMEGARYTNDRHPPFAEAIPQIAIPKNSHNCVRILPRIECGDDDDVPTLSSRFTYNTTAHFINLPNLPYARTYYCPRNINKECPLCEERDKQILAGNKPATHFLRATQYFLCWVIDRNNEDKGPQIWRISRSLITKMLTAYTTRDGQRIYPYSEFSYDLLFTSTDSGKGFPIYDNVITNDSLSRIHTDESVLLKWLQFVLDNNIDNTVNYYSYDEIKSWMDESELVKNLPSQHKEPIQMLRGLKV